MDTAKKVMLALVLTIFSLVIDFVIIVPIIALFLQAELAYLVSLAIIPTWLLFYLAISAGKKK